MHELSIASTLVESILKFANTPPPKKMLKVLLQIGELTCLEPEQLQFCYSAVAQETAIQDSTLEFERTPIEVACAPRYGHAGLHLDPIPLLTQDGVVKVALARATAHQPHAEFSNTRP